jgi:hypothetical protein
MTTRTAARRLLTATGTATAIITLAPTPSSVAAHTPKHASATPHTTGSFTARLDAGTQTPKQTSPNLHAGGSFSATALPTRNGYRLHWQLVYGRLTGPATAAYLRQGKPGQTGPAWILLCSPCTPGTKGSNYFSPPQYIAAEQGAVYVAVYTAKNPAGEIRGQLAPA